jgi:anti-anti-sigma factor
VRLADVQFSSHGRTLLARLTGEIDPSNAENIGRAVVEAMPNDAHALVLDLSAIDHLDSSGIQLIYQLRDSLGGRGQILRLVIPVISPAHDALRLAGVARYVETIETVDDAMREFE